MSDPLRAPFPWFGGKSRAAPLIWERFGKVRNYVEPFFGSGAVLLGSPEINSVETVNDLDGFVCNFWRSVKLCPDETAYHADWPVNECDLHARHHWLVQRRAELSSRLEGDPEYCDPQIAGWWVWGACCWIAGGWCSGKGPWSVVDGQFVKGAGQGIKRQRPHLGTGVKRQLPHLNYPQGVNRQLVNLCEWMQELSARLARVRVCCGDWARVTGPTPTTRLGLTAVLLDPPYADTAKRAANLYACDSESVAHDVRHWAIDHGDDPKMRIALCGYDGEHGMPDTWSEETWHASSGYGTKNAHKERIWFSPHCIGDKSDAQGGLF